MKRTPLYAMHINAGAKMVPFAGYEMPLQYTAGILKEHLHTREAAGLFDVSHMGQVLVSGDTAAAALEQLLPVDADAMQENRMAYTFLTNQQGGIRDDLMLTRLAADQFMLVVNAACKEEDLAYLNANLEGCAIDYRESQALLALQGPAASSALAGFVPQCEALPFMSGCDAEIAGIPCYVSRSGYTGEDGFEISVAGVDAAKLASALLEHVAVDWVGLGARDSLRLEAGLCLYGHDLDETTTPVEAGLVWSIAKSRRPEGGKAGGFPGANVIFQQLEQGAGKKRVGFAIEGRAPVREGMEVIDENGTIVGKITSGGFGPSLEAPLAMGYVDASVAGEQNRLYVELRGKRRTLVINKMPLVPHRYYRG